VLSILRSIRVSLIPILSGTVYFNLILYEGS
jgi:hypothetical protein